MNLYGTRSRAPELRQCLTQAIGRQVYLTRRAQGMTGEDLASRLGVSQQQVSRYERGVCKIDVDTLLYFLNEMNVALSDFSHNVSQVLKEMNPSAHVYYQSLLCPKVNVFSQPYFFMKMDRYPYMG